MCANRHLLAWTGEQWEYAKREGGAATKPEKDPETESAIQDTIADFLTNAGWLVVRINSVHGRAETKDRRTGEGQWLTSYFIYGLKGTGMKPTIGFPDLLALKDGRAELFEVKTAKGRVGEAQNAFIGVADKHHVPVHVVRSVDDVREAIDRSCLRVEIELKAVVP